MFGAIGIADGQMLFVDIYAGDGTVVEQEPGYQSVRSVLPGEFQDGAHEVDEESAVADESDMFFGLTILVAMSR